MSPSKPSRVVVVDDSAFMRRLITDALYEHGFDVVASVENGEQALTACRVLQPDVMTLDLTMPGLDGIAVLRRLANSKLPLSVLVVSSFTQAQGAITVDALAEGAFDLVVKPEAGANGEGLSRFIAELSGKVRLAGHARHELSAAARQSRDMGRIAARPARPRRLTGPRAVVIACSTGGPRALTDLLPKLPSPLGAGALIVQHMPAGFTNSLATRLDRTSALNVREAQSADRIDPHTALIAPGGRHLRIGPNRTARLDDDAPVGGLRPCADLTIGDAAATFGPDLVLVVLSGMGKDGLKGAREVHRRGGRILAEAESSCVVYGMSRAIIEAGLADGVHDLSELPAAIAREAGV